MKKCSVITVAHENTDMEYIHDIIQKKDSFKAAIRCANKFFWKNISNDKEFVNRGIIIFTNVKNYKDKEHKDFIGSEAHTVIGLPDGNRLSTNIMAINPYNFNHYSVIENIDCNMVRKFKDMNLIDMRNYVNTHPNIILKELNDDYYEGYQFIMLNPLQVINEILFHNHHEVYLEQSLIDNDFDDGLFYANGADENESFYYDIKGYSNRYMLLYNAPFKDAKYFAYGLDRTYPF